MLRLASAAPRTAAAWTSDGTSYEQRGLKHRPDGTIRMVPAPPVLVAMLRTHVMAYGTAPDGRLFRGTRGGPLSESVYGGPGTPTCSTSRLAASSDRPKDVVRARP